MIQINLLPDVKKEHLKAVRQRRFIVSVSLISSGVFLGLVILLAFTVFIAQKKHISDLTKDIETSIAELNKVDNAEKILTIQNQLSLLPGLYDEKPNATNLFKYLKVVTPSNVKLTTTQLDYTSDSSTNMEFSGNTATFKDANRFVDILKNARYTMTDEGTGDKVSGPAFTKVVLESIGKSSSANRDQSRATLFTISVQYNSDIFDIKYSGAKLEVPSIVSSVSNTQSPSFNEQPFDDQPSEGGGQ